VKVELHCHSTASDGTDAPGAVAARAAGLGIELFCLTDHDTCAGWEAVVAAAAEAGGGMRVMRGVEVSAGEGGRTVHLLVYDIAASPGWGDVDQRLAVQAGDRRARMREMLARLAARGVAVEMADVLAEADGAVLGRPHLARALVKRRVVSNVGEAFDRWLGDGGPADVPLARLDVERVLELATAAGARVSLAHPHTLGPALAADLLRRNRARGLDAVEVFYGAYGARERGDWLAMARDLGVTATGGSDYHGTASPDVPQPGIELDEPHASRLRAWLGLA
jgi:predicted metal-dependent phosphoesterase TrpH